MAQAETVRYTSFKEFYPFYLSEHSNRTCRRLHFVGSWLGLFCFAWAIWSADWRFVPLAFVCGYLFAWIGHFGFEKNRPATFQYPLYSFMGDWVMWKDMLTGKIKF